MSMKRWLSIVLLAGIAGAPGCNSPYRADRGAALGALGGAGVGALVGHAVGNTGAGAVVGAGVGALSGAVVGDQLDQIEARNRAEIEARLGRPVAAGAVSIDDVIAMSQAGVAEDVIANHVRIHGAAAPLQTGDIITLQKNGVSSRVIQAMQQPPQPPVMVQQGPPPPVIVERYYDDPWFYGPPYPYWRHHHHYCRPPGVSWGVSFGR